MMNIFQQYGIKEVANVCLYSIELDENDNEIYVPVLYLDTLKVSTVEQSSSSVAAKGGLGNPKLITWDYEKEIKITLEDALFTPAQQSMLQGGVLGVKGLKLYLRNFEDRTQPKEPTKEEIEKILDSHYDWIEYNQEQKYSMAYTEWLNSRIIGATLIINNFSDFCIILERDKEEYVGNTSIYCWLVNAIVISNDTKHKVILDDLIIFYREQTQKWYFYNGNGIKQNYKDLYDNDHIKHYGIGYQYGKDTFDWIKENLSKSNVEYEKVAQVSINFWKGEEVAESASVNFLTQILYIDGYKRNECAIALKYSDDLIEEAKINSQPCRFEASIDLEYNTNIALPQNTIYEINHELNDVQYLERIEKCTAKRRFCIDTDINLMHGEYRFLDKYSETELVVFINPNTMQPYSPNSYEYYKENGDRITGNLKIFKKGENYYKWTRTKAKRCETLGKQIIINANNFPGVYRLVGETYMRDRLNGKDYKYQFEVPLCKMSSNNNIVLQAEGEPTTFTMELDVLKNFDDSMMKLTMYETEENCSGSSQVVSKFTRPKFEETNANWSIDIIPDLKLNVEVPETIDLAEIMLRDKFDDIGKYGVNKQDETISGD